MWRLNEEEYSSSEFHYSPFLFSISIPFVDFSLKWWEGVVHIHGMLDDGWITCRGNGLFSWELSGLSFSFCQPFYPKMRENHYMFIPFFSNPSSLSFYHLIAFSFEKEIHYILHSWARVPQYVDDWVNKYSFLFPPLTNPLVANMWEWFISYQVVEDSYWSNIFFKWEVHIKYGVKNM